MSRRKMNQVLLVEGKYDAARLANLVDTLIVTTDGFDIYKNREKQRMLKKLARERRMVVLTDSDAAGFKIRHFVTNLVGVEYILQAFVPAIAGKEKRKAEPGKEGLLGVEGIADEKILTALEQAGVWADCANFCPIQQNLITYYDLTEWGLSGGENSAEFRRAFLKSLDLPPRISKKSLLEVLNALFTRETIESLLQEFCSDYSKT